MNELSTAMLDHQLTAILVLNRDLSVSYSNSAMNQLLGTSSKRLLNLPFHQLTHLISLKKEFVLKTFDEGISFTDSHGWVIHEARPHLVELSGTTMQFEQQQFVIIELRQIEQQRKINQESVQHAQQQAAKELVRGLAHEIKNPLGGLRGAAQLLEKELPDPAQKEYTQIIIEQADRLRKLVDRLLGPQQLGTKKNDNIHAVLERVCQLTHLNNPDSIKITRDYDPSLPEFVMDSEQIEQAILNIVNNAAHALENQNQGEIIIRSRTEHQATVHGKQFRLVARIDIIDNGPGIPDHIQDTLFYPMVTGRKNGTGLGLSIAQNLIDQHQGKIEVSTVPGNTKFSLYLPIQ
ncbi:nitrogen regulation protein NR(II) [Vibrio sp. SS-MA-C1-2]|uniref:nitrogen regulation protein NR(II) n=1 Tax=Vibrio sp. SS-MA-C1-2 TaxID=2908646 RepID=UPI001F244808|nr:nitrogen regulation protein NR(II) [Vibrio sp. SS-MA-C1-2]UJF19432.1 nitrogen regulation protein NR(II) [Vibrio sp. SS-MA-C1-2]